MAFDGLLPAEVRSSRFIVVDVAGNPYSRAPVLEGDVKVHDRLALMFGYAAIGVTVGAGTAMVATVAYPAAIPVMVIASVFGALLLARNGLRQLHWGAAALVIAMHLSALAAVASMVLPELASWIVPIAGAFAVVLAVLAIAYGRWFRPAMNVAVQALLLSAPFGAALTHAFFNRGF